MSTIKPSPSSPLGRGMSRVGQLSPKYVSKLLGLTLRLSPSREPDKTTPSPASLRLTTPLFRDPLRVDVPVSPTLWVKHGVQPPKTVLRCEPHLLVLSPPSLTSTPPQASDPKETGRHGAQDDWAWWAWNGEKSIAGKLLTARSPGDRLGKTLLHWLPTPFCRASEAKTQNTFCFLVGLKGDQKENPSLLVGRGTPGFCGFKGKLKGKPKAPLF